MSAGIILNNRRFKNYSTTTEFASPCNRLLWLLFKGFTFRILLSEKYIKGKR